MPILDLSVDKPKAKSANGIILNGGIKLSTNNYLPIEYLTSHYNTTDNPYVSGVVKTSVVTSSKEGGFHTFGYNNQRPLTKGSTLLINNATSDHELKTPGTIDTNLRTNIHYTRYTRTRLLATAIREKTYDPFTNIFQAGAPGISYDDFGIDSAAVGLSKSNTGKLAYTNGVAPVVKLYPPKT